MKNRRRFLFLFGCLLGLHSFHPTSAWFANQAKPVFAQESNWQAKKIVPYVPTPQDVVRTESLCAEAVASGGTLLTLPP